MAVKQVNNTVAVTIIRIRLHFVILRFTFGNTIKLNKKPPKKPKTFAKLSIIGKKPINSIMNMIVEVFKAAIQGET